MPQMINLDQIEQAANPANLTEYGIALTMQEVPLESAFAGIENTRGEISAGTVESAKYYRSYDYNSVVVQNTADDITSDSTIPVRGGTDYISVHRIPTSQLDGIGIEEQPRSYAIRNGIRVPLTADMIVQDSIAKMFMNNAKSGSILLFELLKHGRLLNMKDHVQKIIAGASDIAAVWNNYDFLKLWSDATGLVVARPTGAHYTEKGLTEGFMFDFKPKGALDDFTARLRWTFKQKHNDMKSIFKISNGSTVLLGLDAWSDFMKAEDLKSKGFLSNPDYFRMARLEFNDAHEVVSVIYNGIRFMCKDYQQTLEYQGRYATFKTMQDDEILCLPNAQEPIVDLIRFNIKTIDSGADNWASSTTDWLWTKRNDANTRFNIGMRSSIGFGSRAPELAVLGKLGEK
ncbi:MAG: hypothetical protein ACRC0X_02105 [Brevinema sp.]